MGTAMRTGQPEIRLRAFVFGSALLHGAMLSIWQSTPWQAGQASEVLTVILTPDRATAAPAVVRPAAPHSQRMAAHRALASPGNARGLDRHERRPTVPTSVAAAATAAAAGYSAPSDAAADRAPDRPAVNDTQNGRNPLSPAAPASSEARENDLASSRIQARLHSDLARYFDYPYAARLRGWEGMVLLAFDIETDGRLHAIRIARSSGHAVLDDAALRALQRVERLPEAVAWLHGQALSLRVPVIYRLRCSGAPDCREHDIAAAAQDR
jgi:protein TonB